MLCGLKTNLRDKTTKSQADDRELNKFYVCANESLLPAAPFLFVYLFCFPATDSCYIHAHTCLSSVLRSRSPVDDTLYGRVANYPIAINLNGDDTSLRLANL